MYLTNQIKEKHTQHLLNSLRSLIIVCKNIKNYYKTKSNSAKLMDFSKKTQQQINRNIQNRACTLENLI